MTSCNCNFILNHYIGLHYTLHSVIIKERPIEEDYLHNQYTSSILKQTPYIILSSNA